MTDITDLLNAMDKIDCLPKNGDPIIDDRKRNYKNKDNKSCTYRLKYDGDDIIGWFKNHATSEFSKYISKQSSKLSKEEIEERKKKMHNERRIRDRQLKIDQEKAKKRAQFIWKKSDNIGDHEYLSRKGILGTGSKTYKGMVIVPAYKDKEIVNLQMISASGEKRFLRDAIVTGSYGAVGKDKSRIYVSEGYATAISVYEAVKPYVSVWSFVAGNINETVSSLRDKNPDSEIIICADNDQWRFAPKCKPENFKDLCDDINHWMVWKKNGLLENIGIIKSLDAAEKYNAKIIWPDFDFNQDDLNHGGTDFNDYYLHRGLDSLKLRLSAYNNVSAFKDGEIPALLSFCVVTESDRAHSPSSITSSNNYDKNWQEQMICDGKGNPVKTSLKNNILLFTHHDVFKNIFKYNEFNHKITVAACPPWENEDGFHPHDLTDIDISQATALIEDYGLSPDVTRTHKAIQVAADNNKFHPAIEYFNTLKWDGVNRLDTWIEKYYGADLSDGKEYLSFIGKKWLTAAVKRIYKAGCGFHHILVIEGNQGAGKSQSLKTLSTFGLDRPEAYFTDSVSLTDIQNKDTIPKLQGSIIVELAELSGFSKKDDEEIKRWITLDHDLTRLPYERTPKRFNRQFVLAATTNNTDYLKDPTGNRRFWPFIAGKIDEKGLQRDKEQLWAEAVHLYKSGFDIIPDVHERKLAEEVTGKRMQVDTWEDSVENAIISLGLFKTKEGFKTQEVMKEMGLGLRDQDFRNSHRVSRIIQVMGYESKIKRVNGKSQRVWIKETKPEMDEEELSF